MKATVGDQIVIKGHHVGEPDRDAEILEVHGDDGSPPYVVRWADDGHEGLFYPGPDVSIRHLGDAKPRGAGDSANENELVKITFNDCVELLRTHEVGRIAAFVNQALVIVPVNYRLVQSTCQTWIAFRTRLGGILDSSSLHVAFEIDHIDEARHRGWSVLVRGSLQEVDPDAADFKNRFDSEPWVIDRDAWMMIKPVSIEGRRLQPR
jgi:Domain of unknown function (DUF1918)/Pyridoxamine 5'-phosphate oxidase